MTDISNLRIDTHGSVTTDKWQVFLNEIEITRAIRHINLDAGVHDIPTITLQIISTLELPETISGFIDVVKADLNNNPDNNTNLLISHNPPCSFCDKKSVGVVYGDESSTVPTGNIYYCEDHRKDAKTWERKS